MERNALMQLNFSCEAQLHQPNYRSIYTGFFCLFFPFHILSGHVFFLSYYCLLPLSKGQTTMFPQFHIYRHENAVRHTQNFI